MSKPLEELSASKAGVEQAELESAYVSLGTLEAELLMVDADLAAALTAKAAVEADLATAKAAVVAADAIRSPVFEEWQRADWIVRNADPDVPPPPVGGGGAPEISSPRS